MKSPTKSVLLVLIAALTAALLVSSIAIANNQVETAKKKKKATLTSKQKKSINKMIDAKIKKIQFPAAPVGPAAYSASNAADSGTLPNSVVTYTKILDLPVPAGKYAVSGRVNVNFVTNDNTNTVFARCNVKDAAGNTIDDTQGTSGPDQLVLLVVAGYVNLSFNATIDEPAATTLSINCANGNGTANTTHASAIGAKQARLTAVRVASIN